MGGTAVGAGGAAVGVGGRTTTDGGAAGTAGGTGGAGAGVGGSTGTVGWGKEEDPTARCTVTAQLPAYSALGSERGAPLPPLRDCLARFMAERSRHDRSELAARAA